MEKLFFSSCLVALPSPRGFYSISAPLVFTKGNPWKNPWPPQLYSSCWINERVAKSSFPIARIALHTRLPFSRFVFWMNIHSTYGKQNFDKLCSKTVRKGTDLNIAFGSKSKTSTFRLWLCKKKKRKWKKNFEKIRRNTNIFQRMGRTVTFKWSFLFYPDISIGCRHVRALKTIVEIMNRGRDPYLFLEMRTYGFPGIVSAVCLHVEMSRSE